MRPSTYVFSSGRHCPRAVPAYCRLQNCSAQPRQELCNRRISVLQCASSSIDTDTLSQLSTCGTRDSSQCLDVALSRRPLLALAALAAVPFTWDMGAIARAEEVLDPGAASGPASPPAPADAAPLPLVEYSNAKQQYRLEVPPAWDVKGKAGADVLFEDPSRRSTSVGVTVSPVKVPSLEQFGALRDVGERLLQAERNKESTLDVALLSASSRQGAAGATLYQYEYELSSTRGRRRILNTVTIFKSRLYILNASIKCDKEGCGQEAESRGVQLLRRVAASFDVTAAG